MEMERGEREQRGEGAVSAHVSVSVDIVGCPSRVAQLAYDNEPALKDFGCDCGGGRLLLLPLLLLEVPVDAPRERTFSSRKARHLGVCV